MKKICHITTVHSPFDTRIFYKEAKALANAEYEVSLIAQHDKKEIVEEVKIIPLPKPKNRLERFFELDRLAYNLAVKQKADIYHFHDPEFLSWAIKLKKKTDAKIIYDVHEDYPKQILSKYWIPKLLRNIIASFFNFYEKRKTKNVDYIITATLDIKNNFKQDNVIDIKNYPVITNLDFSKNQKSYEDKNYYTLIYIGGLEKVRGIKEIVQSLKFINPKYKIKLKLAGKFSDENFKNEIKKLKEWEKVQYLGQLSHSQVLKHLTRADVGLVCLHPLRRFLTSLPVKMFEYMAAELPVIASNFPLWKEIIELNNCGICINPLKPKEIAKAIEYLIEHPDEAKEMGERGRKAVLEKYNWENESKKLLKVYEELAKK
ncbi:MAG: glycosyltransferase family 4 protein [Candidatus Pacebacteria bacterium]|nr:glycosyltransferase family 4 protein [Candidatus Paceibacterota bacterium]